MIRRLWRRWRRRRTPVALPPAPQLIIGGRPKAPWMLDQLLAAQARGEQVIFLDLTPENELGRRKR